MGIHHVVDTRQLTDGPSTESFELTSPADAPRNVLGRQDCPWNFPHTGQLKQIFKWKDRKTEKSVHPSINYSAIMCTNNNDYLMMN